MALNPIDLQCVIYASADGQALYFRDLTGLYSSNNTGGYGLPGGAPSSAVTSFEITLSYTGLSIDLVYNFTVVNNVITAATATLASATPVNILAYLESTVFPFTSANPFNLTNSAYTLLLPDLEDMVFEIAYTIEGTYTLQAFGYDTVDQMLYNFNTYCCISKGYTNLQLANVNPNEMSPVMIADGYMQTAIAANGEGLTDRANDYIQRANALCDQISNNCGCNN